MTGVKTCALPIFFHFRARGNFYSFLVGTACMHTSRIIAAVCISVLQLVLSHSKASLKLSKKRSSILLYRSHENEPFHLLSGHPDSVSKKRKKSDSVTVSFFNEIFTAGWKIFKHVSMIKLSTICLLVKERSIINSRL